MLENTIPILKKLIQISNSAIIEYPKTILTNDHSIIAAINLDDLGEENFEKFGIYNLSQFLNLIDYFGENTFIEKKDENVIINNGKLKQLYETTSINLLEKFSVKPEIFEKVKSVKTSLYFELNNDDLKHIKKIASILGHTDLIIDAKEKRLIITTLDANDNFQNPNYYPLDIDTNETNMFIFDILNISKIPDGNYEFHIKRNPKTNNPIGYLKNIDEAIELIISIKKEI
jgi:hypothetical protein